MIKEKKYFVSVLLCILTIAVFVVFSIGQALGAQNDYPNKPIRIIIGVSPGGANETSARTYQPYLEKELGVPIEIDCMPGGNGIIADTVALEQEPDGYTFVQTSPAGPFIRTELLGAPYDVDDFEILSIVVNDPAIIQVHKDSQWQTLEELIEYMREHPGTIVSSATSMTDPTVIPRSVLQDELGLDFNIVPFQGGNPARMALAGRHVDVNFTHLFGSRGIEEFRRVLGVFQEKNLWPEISDNAPTVNDALGLNIPYAADNISLMAINGFFDQYPERAKIFEEALHRAFTNPEFLEMLEEIGQAGRFVVNTREESQEQLDLYLDGFKEHIHLFEELRVD